ncbi:MAG: hypothetical protein LC749_17955 [Actinobacteria bacterium]|nr:hypothetical protein [Actinomycetota bacterium]
MRTVLNPRAVSPPGPARVWQLRGGTLGGLVTGGVRAVDDFAPCGVVAPVRVNGGLAGGEPVGNGRAAGQRRTTS